MSVPEQGRHSPAYWLWVCATLAVLAFYLWTEHRAHTLGALPWLLLLACPLLHLFLHRGHHGHGDSRREIPHEPGSHDQADCHHGKTGGRP